MILLPLASIEAVRPVGLVVLGAFLLLFAWRISRSSGRWAARLLTGGALLLALGYMIVLPMYEAGLILPLSMKILAHPQAETWLVWHLIKISTMNLGWFGFGLGLGIHSGFVRFPCLRPSTPQPSLIPGHGTVA